MSDRIILEVKEHIAEVVLDRPEKMNALDEKAFSQLRDIAHDLKQDSGVRVVLIRSSSDHFCAGADKAFLQGAVSDKTVFEERALNLPDGQIANEFQQPAIAWQELDVPVIACLRGVVIGAGFQIALGADIRIADSSCRMSLFEINWGLIPDMGVTQTLPGLVGSDVAMELMLTGRMVDAQEALALGLITSLQEDATSVAMKKASEIARKSPDATKRIKRLMREAANLSRAEGLALEARLQAELVGTHNQMEAAMANLQKRDPEFR